MIEDTNTYRDKGRALFLAAIMVMSVVAMTASLAAPVAASANVITAVNADDVTVGVASTNQQIEFDVGNIDDGTSDNVTIDLSNAAAENVAITGVTASSDDTSNDGVVIDDTQVTGSNIYVDISNPSGTGSGSATVTATATHDTSSANVASSVDYTVSSDTGGASDTDNFDLVGASDVTANDLDVSVNEETANITVYHSDRSEVDNLEIAVADRQFDTTVTGSVTDVLTDNTGNTTFKVDLSDSNGDPFELGTIDVYAAAWTDEDTGNFDSGVDESNSQVSTSFEATGLEVTDFSGPRVAANGTVVEYDIEVTNTGSSEVTQDVDLVASDNESSLDLTDTSTQSGDSPYDSEEVTVGSGNSTTVTLELNTGNLQDASDRNSEYEIGAFTQGSPVSGAKQSLVVGSSSSGSVTINVVDDASNQRDNVTVRLWLRSDTFDQNKVLREGTTNENGDVTFTNLAVGADDNNRIFYTARAGEDNPSLGSTTTDLELYESTQTSDSSTVTLQRNILPDRIEVEQDKHTAVADGEDEIQFTVTLFGDDADESPLEGEDINVRTDGDGVTFDPAQQTLETDENGQVVWNVSSDVVESAEFNFYHDDAADTTDPSLDLVVNETKNFVLSGEGSLAGSLVNDATTNGVEDGDVWVVTSERYDANNVTTRIDLSSDGLDHDDDTVWIRLVDNETNSIINNDDYDIRVQEESSQDGTAVRKVDALNASDASVGQGYALIDADGDEEIVFSHTRLEDREYYAQVSLNAENASAQSNVLDTGTENFVNVTQASVLPGTPDTIDDLPGGTDQVVFEPSENLTLAATEQLANFTGANYVDTPGFVNSYGEDTEGTTDDGRWALSKLPTNFQEGVTYVAIGTKTGFSTDFADVLLTEDGDLTFEEQQGSNELFVEPVPVEPDGIDIQQEGTYENASGQAPLVEFLDKTDPTYQEVPRDGSTVDVFWVNTTAEGDRVNATADVTIQDTSVAGEFVNIASGQYVSRNNASNTATITTGSDGTAVIWYQADQGSNDVDTTKTATLDNDQSVTDESNVSFLGVLEFESAEVSGIVTNSDNDPVPSVVYTEELTAGGTDFTVEPATPDLDMFTVSRLDNAGNVVESANITRAQAQNYDFQTNATGAPAFQGTSIASNFPGPGATLVTVSTDGVDEASSYTLPRVPAVQGRTNNVAVAATSQASADSATSLSELETGRAVSTPTEVNRTSTANVEITGAQPATFAVNSVTVTPENATQGESVTVEAVIENQGAVTADADVTYLFGETISDATEQDSTTTVPLATGETDTVTFTLDTSGLAPGDYVNVIETVDDTGTADLTVEEQNGNGTSWWEPYTNEDGVVESTDLLRDGIDAWRSEDIDTGQLRTLIESWRSKNPVAPAA